MKRILLIAVAVSATLALVFAQSRSSQSKDSKQAAREQRKEERQQRRAQRLAEYEKYVDSLVLSRNFRFTPLLNPKVPIMEGWESSARIEMANLLVSLMH